MFKSVGLLIPGLAVCCLVALIAVGLAPHIPLGAITLAIMLGILVGNLVTPGINFQPGITYAEKTLLSFAIALMGVNLNFMILRELGYLSILLVVAGVGLTLSTALVLAKLMNFDSKFALLLGIGNGICGSSAIAATEHIVGARKEDVGLSVAVINFLGTLGIFVLPFIGSIVLGFTDINAGLLIGNTLQAVGQVVAAGFSVSESAGQTATIVKMTRILMLTPVVFILIFVFSRSASRNPVRLKKAGQIVPLFIVCFALTSLIPTFGLLPEKYILLLSKASHYALVVAMAAIGMRITFKSILQDGKAALLIGSLIFVVQIVFSSSVIYLFLK